MSNIELRDLYPNRQRPSHDENIRLSNAMRQGDPRARQKLIEANAGLAYNNAIRYAFANKSQRRIHEDDLLQAAFCGLIEAVDKYNPDLGHKFVTYAHWWVNKRILEVVEKTHWATVKPPRKTMQSYMYRTEGEDGDVDAYTSTFMTYHEAAGIEEHLPDQQTLDPDYMDNMALSNTICSCFDNMCSDGTMTLLQEVVFSRMHDPRTPPETERELAKDLGLPLADIKEAEIAALDLLRLAMGVFDE